MAGVEAAREAFFNMIADADRFEEDIDGDCDSNGRTVMTINYHLTIGHSQLQELCDALGLPTAQWGETEKDRIYRAIENTSAESKP